jgi:hypothetical protein
VADAHRITKRSRRLAVYARCRTLEDVLLTFEARARARMAHTEERILARRRETVQRAIEHDDFEAGTAGRKPNLSEYEGSE